MKSLNKPDLSDAWSALASDYSTEILKYPEVGQSNRSGSLEDIANLFHERFDKLRKVLRQQAGFRETASIKDCCDERKRVFKNRTYNIIGIVSDTKRTKSGGKMVTLEDPTGEMKVFIRKEDPASDSLMMDDVVGISGKYDKENQKMFWVDEVHYADILMNHINRGGPECDPVSIAFLSDIHVGSKYFLQETWDKMMNWLKTDTLAKNIKYFVFAGDVIDGIGIYPGQENNLEIANSFDQYEFFARLLDDLPDHIIPIIIPGNHDAVRPAEPQPILETAVQQKFNSAIHIGNPCRVNLSGIEVLAYHGKGMDDLVPALEDVTYENSINGMKHMLKKRHLAPVWGGRNALSAEETDQMIIERPPDIFVTGHSHSAAFEWYRGIPCLVSSTMQGQTPFMNMHGFDSAKGYLTIYNIQNREAKVIQFHPNDDPFGNNYNQHL